MPREVALGLISSEVNKVKILVAQPCLTLCDPRDCSWTGSSVHGILRQEYWSGVVLPFSRGSFWPRDQTWVSCIAGRFLIVRVPREASGLIRSRRSKRIWGESAEKSKCWGVYILDSDDRYNVSWWTRFTTGLPSDLFLAVCWWVGCRCRAYQGLSSISCGLAHQRESWLWWTESLKFP